MEYVIRGLSVLLIPLLVRGVLAFLRRPKAAERGRVYLPGALGILGLVVTLIFLIPTVITAFSAESVRVPAALFGFSLLGSILIVAYVNCRISYDEEGFVAKSFFGIKRRYSYVEVTAIKENMHETYLYVGRRRVMIDEFSVGGDEFIALVKKKYKKLHDGKALPRIKRRGDIFNGNIEDVGGFLFAYIALSIFIVAFAVFLVWYIYFTPSTAENTVARSPVFTSCVTEGEDLVLTATDGRICKVRFIDAQTDTAGIAAICDGQTAVTVYVKEMTPEDGEPYDAVKAIMRGDEAVLSFAETDRLHRGEYAVLLLFPLVFAVVWGGYVVLSIIVGRNPKRFGKKIVGLFFKEGYVKWDAR